MLALAHGSKGIMFSDYYKYWFDSDGGGWIDGIVDSLDQSIGIVVCNPR